MNRYGAAIDRLFAGWSGKASESHYYDDGQAQAGQTGQARYAQGNTQGRAQASPATQAAAYSTPADRRPRRTVMVGGTGVYAIVKTGGNTDQGTPTIIAEAVSGPIKGSTFIGTYARRGSSNQTGTMPELRFTRMTYNGQDIEIDAFAISLQTRDSAIASRKDHHTVERIILPGAAALVEGLGQAFALSGSSASYGLLGGGTSYRSFSPEQLGGIAAGSAGRTVGQILREQAPKESTFYVDADAEIAVMFRQSVTVEE